ncbi:helix-hairpin-helix domain-containing protein [Ornithinibacillus xuwenensis]|uniref:Helix-hairpin-helix domain-containing protein n=1 Tax=Ornithinibacillus xuwenensis TaxID=3144668 RepID=A0ABU9XIQ5_9BACI
MKVPKLPLTLEEKARLRKKKITLADITSLSTNQLRDTIGSSIQRAIKLKGLAEFQQVPSIGQKLAEKLVYELEVFSLAAIREEDGARLFDALEIKLGVWTDPCVEDQIRCVIHFANYPDSKRQWFDFTNERKIYRETYGYPNTRPTKAWFEESS